MITMTKTKDENDIFSDKETSKLNKKGTKNIGIQRGKREKKPMRNLILSEAFLFFFGCTKKELKI